MIERINNQKVVEYKAGKMHLNGEFSIYLKTEKDNYYFCNCEKSSKQINFRTKQEITAQQFENADSHQYRKHVKIPIDTPNNITDKVEPDRTGHIPQNFFQDTHFFGSGKVHRIEKEELEELAQEIKQWTTQYNVPDEAIHKTYGYLLSRYKDVLTESETKEFCEKLLRLRSGRLEKTFTPPEPPREPQDVIPEKNVIIPPLEISPGAEEYGLMIQTNIATAGTGRSKLGGYPDLPEDNNNIPDLEGYYFIGQFDTSVVSPIKAYVPKGLLSILIPKSIEGTEYYNALPAKIIFTKNGTPVEPYNRGQEILDQQVCTFQTLNEVSLQSDDPTAMILSKQFLPSLYKDEYGQQLILSSFNKIKDKALDMLPDLEEFSPLQVTPILRFAGYNLKRKGKSAYSAMTIIVFMPTVRLEKADFQYSFCVMEP